MRQRVDVVRTVEVIRVQGYMCPVCTEIHSRTPRRVREGWRIPGDLVGEDQDTALERPVPCTVRECAQGEFFCEDPELVDGYQCAECEEVYGSAKLAASCC